MLHTGRVILKWEGVDLAACKGSGGGERECKGENIYLFFFKEEECRKGESDVTQSRAGEMNAL